MSPVPAPLIDSMIVFVLKLEKFPPISCLVLESNELTVRKCKNLIRLLYSDKLTRSLQMPIINISLCIVHVFRGKAFPVRPIKTLTAKFDSGTVSNSTRKY